MQTDFLSLQNNNYGLGGGNGNNGVNGEKNMNSPKIISVAPKLFVGQIPKTIQSDTLTQLFSPFGKIHEISVITDKLTGAHRGDILDTPGSYVAFLMLVLASNFFLFLSPGCAFVTYSTKAEADAAINGLHNVHTIPPMSKALQVKYADGELEKLEHKLFIGMVPKTANEDDLKTLFERYGAIEEITILRDKQTNISKGCAFVKYSSREDALDAINHMNGQMCDFQGSTSRLVVKFADTADKKRKQQMQQQQQHQQNILSSPAAAVALNPYAQFYQQTPYLTTAGAANPLLAYGTTLLANAPVTSLLAGPPQREEGPPGANLFIYHLPQEIGDRELAQYFAPFGNVISSKVFIDRNTAQSKCFGFVSYDNAGSAQTAIANMNGFQIGGKRLKVQLKRSKESAKPY